MIYIIGNNINDNVYDIFSSDEFFLEILNVTRVTTLSSYFRKESFSSVRLTFFSH